MQGRKDFLQLVHVQTSRVQPILGSGNPDRVKSEDPFLSPEPLRNDDRKGPIHKQQGRCTKNTARSAAVADVLRRRPERCQSPISYRAPRDLPAKRLRPLENSATAITHLKRSVGAPPSPPRPSQYQLHRRKKKRREREKRKDRKADLEVRKVTGRERRMEIQKTRIKMGRKSPRAIGAQNPATIYKYAPGARGREGAMRSSKARWRRNKKRNGETPAATEALGFESVAGNAHW